MEQKTITSPTKGSDILALGFGTTTAMWAVGYLGRHPAISLPAWLILVLMIACQFLGGWAAGRYVNRGWKGGLWTGLISSLLNLLILGSFLSGDSPGSIVPSALIWLPGSVVFGMILGSAGAAVGNRKPSILPDGMNWLSLFAWVAVSATLVLLLAGGVVTGYKAGLAVVDWPNSFGYNMFLYPLSRMTGGIYYEHAHRLLGSLVGLTTVVLAVQIQRMEDRRWLKRLAWLAVLAVIVQGIMGGLRVTGRFTLSDSPSDVEPITALAIAHGIFGQVFFGLLAALAICSSNTWRTSPSPLLKPSSSTDRTIAIILILLLIVQIMLGALQRHLTQGLLIHISFAVVVVLFGLMAGVRAWGLYPDLKPLSRSGVTLLVLIAVQITLGVAALVVKGVLPGEHEPAAFEVIITTLHQVSGALLLAAAVGICLWSFRLLAVQHSGVMLAGCNNECK